MKFDRAVAVYVLDDRDRVLLLLHKKLRSWLPPGGHVEEDELIHEAAIREVKEEAGINFEFIYNTGNINSPEDRRARILPQPLLIQLEEVGDHCHEDFVYLARAKAFNIVNYENHEIGWFTLEEAVNLNIFDNVRKHLEHIKNMILRVNKPLR